jgi:hypothetical protein
VCSSDLALTPEFQTHGSNVESGYGRTAGMLLRDPQHFAHQEKIKKSK